jgi:hypothetical protein
MIAIRLALFLARPSGLELAPVAWQIAGTSGKKAWLGFFQASLACSGEMAFRKSDASEKWWKRCPKPKYLQAM